MPSPSLAASSPVDFGGYIAPVVEDPIVVTGSYTATGTAGDDHWDLVFPQPLPEGTNAAISVDGLDGTDTLSIDWSAQSDGSYFGIFRGDGTRINGYVGGWSLDINSFEAVTLIAGAGTVTALLYYCRSQLNIFGGASADSIRGGYADDYLFGGAGGDLLRGEDGNDSIDGGDGNDAIDGGSGNDSLRGEDGDDGITGGTGNDTIRGGDGNDSILGENSYNSVYRDYGNNLIYGDAGNDTILGGDARDTIFGGDGDDLLRGGSYGSDLPDLIYGGAGNDTIDGGCGTDILRGDDGDDVIEGGPGTDTLVGGIGADTLSGGAVSDLLFGGDGNDYLNGGFGFDRLNGGAGADRFSHTGEAGHGTDWIADYSSAEGDRLVFGIATATRDQFQVNWADTANAGEAAVQEAFVVYRPTGQILWALIDGAANDHIWLQIGGVSYDLMA